MGVWSFKNHDICIKNGAQKDIVKVQKTTKLQQIDDQLLTYLTQEERIDTKTDAIPVEPKQS